MPICWAIGLTLIAAWSIFAASAPPGETHAAGFFEEQGCLHCHSLDGRGGSFAGDIARRVARDYSPTLLTTLMWNHAPAMWASARAHKFDMPALDEDRALDLFSFFYTSRYFDKLGDAGRGKRVFANAGCSDCHGITHSQTGGGPSVAAWQSLSDPIALAQQMWNHPRIGGHKNSARRPLTPQGFTDLLLYVRNLPATRDRLKGYSLALYQAPPAVAPARTCGHSQCHDTGSSRVARAQSRNLTEIALVMWNHKPQSTATRPAMSREEMERFVAEEWARAFFSAPRGDAARGKRVFEKKNCVVCHTGSGGTPNLRAAAGGWTTISMVAGLWKHGPRMQDELRRRNLAWPRLREGQMSDLIAYLNSSAGAGLPDQPATLRASLKVGQ